MKKIIYKKVKAYTPHCSECGTQLHGNGSDVLPYKCDCGIWKYNFVKKEYETN